MPKGKITKEQAIATSNNLIKILQKQITDLQEHPEDNFFGSVKDTIKGWNDAIAIHQKDIKHLQSFPERTIVATY